MASELSKFIEDELKSQGIHDDEEQRLLSNLRVKPLSVEQPLQPTGWQSRRKPILFGIATLVTILAAVFMIVHLRQNNLTTRDLVRNEDTTPAPGASVPTPTTTKPPSTLETDYDEFDASEIPQDQNEPTTPTTSGDSEIPHPPADGASIEKDDEEKATQTKSPTPSTPATAEEDDYDYDYGEKEKEASKKSPSPSPSPSPKPSTSSSKKSNDYDYDYDYSEQPPTPKQDGPAASKSTPTATKSPSPAPKSPSPSSSSKKNTDYDYEYDYDSKESSKSGRKLLELPATGEGTRRRVLRTRLAA